MTELVMSGVDFSIYGISKVILFTSITLDIPEEAKALDIVLIEREKNILLNFITQKRRLRQQVKTLGIDLFFCPGGTYPGRGIRYVSMSQNMLVFEAKERRRFPLGMNRFRYKLLNVIQSKSFRNAVGNIFISQYAYDYISQRVPIISKLPNAIIPLGASSKFKQPVRLQKSISQYTLDSPFQLTYVSIINHYKHQWNVVEAVAGLRAKGYPLILNLIGPMNPSTKDRFEKALQGREAFVKYHGSISYQEIEATYHQTDLFVFASTCENMPNVLIEAMSASLPIACSSYGPMPEILKDAGVYFDPLEVESIKTAIEQLLENPILRKDIATKASRYANEYSWIRCAKETYTFLQTLISQSPSP